MKRALIGLVLLPAVVVGCGGSSKPTAAPAPATPAAAAVTGPSADQFTQAKELAAKLGCPNVTVTPAGGVSDGATETDCSVPSGGDPLFDSYTRSILVFADSAGLQRYLSVLRSTLNPHGVSGDRWVVSTDADDQDAAKVQAKVGGTLL